MERARGLCARRLPCGRAVGAAIAGIVLLSSIAAVADGPRGSGLGQHAEPPIPGPAYHFPVWRGGEPSLPDHTIIRPSLLSTVPFLMPVVVWGNGGCRDSNEEFHYFLTTFASYGVFIVADGPPQNPYVPTELTPLLAPHPQKLADGIAWALAQNRDRRSRYFHRLDPRRVLVMGQSCGGWEAVDASGNSRVTSTIIWNSGANPQHPQGVTQLHAPIMFAEGGTLDHVAWDAIATYHAVSVPTIHVRGEDGGHTNWWDDPPPGQPRPSPTQREPLPIAAEWLAFTLYGEASARKYFLGPNCGLCGKPGWTVESRNWPASG